HAKVSLCSKKTSGRRSTLRPGERGDKMVIAWWKTSLAQGRVARVGIGRRWLGHLVDCPGRRTGAPETVEIVGEHRHAHGRDHDTGRKAVLALHDDVAGVATGEGRRRGAWVDETREHELRP